MDEGTAWLLQGSPYVQYRTRRDLLDQPESDPQVIAARQAMLADPTVQALVTELGDWPGKVLSSHKSAGLPMHKLNFLADLGLRPGDPGVDRIVDQVLSHQSPQGPFSLIANIPTAYGGSGQDQSAWALCDAPLVLRALLSFGLGEDDRVVAARDHLIGLVRENGWPCAVSPELGKWRGPGRKDDPCPFATLAMLKALAQAPEWQGSPAARSGAEALLGLWAASRDRHPYMFFMGIDFRKLKAPLVWYDLLHVLDVLTRLPWLAGDPRLTDMLQILAGKADASGRFTPESVWQAWSAWEFGQKRTPSRWLTLLTARILRRSWQNKDAELARTSAGEP